MQINSAFVYRQSNQDGQLTKNNFPIQPCISAFLFFKILVGHTDSEKTFLEIP
jgi:hypothetical protein